MRTQPLKNNLGRFKQIYEQTVRLDMALSTTYPRTLELVVLETLLQLGAGDQFGHYVVQVDATFSLFAKALHVLTKLARDNRLESQRPRSSNISSAPA